jgi:flagellar hook assembly protein FlgD
MKKILALIMAIILTSSYVFASDNGGAFLANGFGARPAALNNSFVARADDSNAIYWNPAGLTQVKGLEIQSMFYNAWETNYTALQGALTLGELHLGIGYLGAGVNDIFTTIPNEQISGRYMVDTGSNFKYQGQAFFLSTAYRILPDLSVGATLKYLIENLASNEAQGMGLDLGLLYKPTDYVSLGLNIQNLYQPKMKWNTESQNTDTIPMVIKSGVLVLLLDNTLAVSTDLDYLLRDIPANERIKVYSGLEWKPIDSIALRLGLNPTQFSQFNRIISSCGAGLDLGVLNLDFSWTNQNPDLDIEEIEDIYRFSVGLNIEELRRNTPIPSAKEKVVVTEEQNIVASENKSEVLAEPTVIQSTSNIVNEVIKVEASQNIEEKKEVEVKEINNVITNVIEQKDSPLQVMVKAPETVKPGAVYTFEILGGKPNAEYLVDFYIKNSSGEKVRKLISGQLLSPGVYKVVWDGNNEVGKKVADGTYYLRIYATSANNVVSNFTKVVLGH